MDKREIKGIVKSAVWLAAFLAACAVTRGWALVPAAFIGLWCAFAQKRMWALIAFVLLPILTCLNPMIVPSGGNGTILQMVARLTLIAMYVVMAIMEMASNGNDSKRIPLGGLIPFLGVAFISSLNGWAPNVSYMKIFNFFVFTIGVWMGTQGLSKNSKDVVVLRQTFIVIILMLSFGSIATIPFPQIAYQQNILTMMVTARMDLSGATAELKERMADGGLLVFAGIMNNSQCLGPLLACSFNLILCDMLFVVQKFSKFHLITMIAIIIPLYLTRSRTALFALGIGVIIIAWMTTSKVQLSARAKKRVKSLVILMLLLGGIAAAASEFSSNTVTKWLRKTNDVEADARDFGEALTNSREGLNEMNWRDFHMNPILGMGFQTMERHRKMYAGKMFVFSAPIEKGLLPLMILGETGVVGAIVFSIFLITFFVGCNKKNLHVTAAMFCVLLASNIGEATFFSPGGAGGTLWIMGLVGGYVIDMAIRLKRQNGLRIYYGYPDMR